MTARYRIVDAAPSFPRWRLERWRWYWPRWKYVYAHDDLTVVEALRRIAKVLP